MSTNAETAGREPDSQGFAWHRPFTSSMRSLTDGIRSDPAGWGSILVVALAAAAFSFWLLDISRHQWFVTDEFDYFNTGGDPLIVWLLRPHNEHTIVFTKAWFVLLGHFVGLRHYVLYMIPLLVGHLVVVGAIYRLTWVATTSRVMATVAALASIAMGAAVGTLTWAGQLQYVGSVAAGLIVIILAIEASTKRAAVMMIIAAVFGTLNGSAFIALGIAAAIVYTRRRRWIEASLAAGIPLVWEVVNRVVWAPKDPYAATGIDQILREAPAFAYSILDTAISQTLLETHMTAVVLAALVLGTLTLISVDVRWRRSLLSGTIVCALALATILTMGSLIVARLSLPADAWVGGGYAYLFLVTLLPLAAIFLAHIARSKSALVGAAGIFLAIALMGAGTFHADAIGLEQWKTSGEQLMQTAAAELQAGMSTYPDQTPVPDTAPTVTQEQLRAWASGGQLDAVSAGPTDTDQASLNMQWRIAFAGQDVGPCRDLSPGIGFAISAGASVSLTGLAPGAIVQLRYPDSSAARQFQIPTSDSSLQTVSQRPAQATVETASVRVCMPSWE